MQWTMGKASNVNISNSKINMISNINNTIQAIQTSLEDLTFIKVSLGHYKGIEKELKNIHIRIVLVKKVPHLSFTYRYKTKDIVSNYTFENAIPVLQELISPNHFCQAHLYTLSFDLLLEYGPKENWRLKKKAPSIHELPSLEHDKPKHRKIAAIGKEYLQELKITDKDGNVYKAAQDKYKQINHYIEILSTLLEKLPEREVTKVVDMGSGKGYLTFALYDYLNNVIHKPAKITGIEYRQDLVDLCNTVATNSGFDGLHFEQGEIDKYVNDDIHVLIALHACDTATDDAIYKGITSNADLIVVAPCCHKQIRREIEKHKANNELDFLIKHGIFLERQAEMVTDGIRTLILEYYGYSTRVFEFISDAHTPKNVLVVGLKRPHGAMNKEGILEKIKSTKAFFGIEYHHLEKMMGMEVS